MEPEPARSDDEVEVFQAFYDSIDNVRVAAWYCVPRGERGPLPAIMVVPGYQSDPGIPKEWARRGYAVLGVAPRGKLRSNGQFDPGYPGLLTYGIVDRNVYSYRGFYVTHGAASTSCFPGARWTPTGSGSGEAVRAAG